MSEQEMNTNHQNWWEQFRFTSVFEGFSSAVQPGKLLLALGGLVAIFLAGWILDGMTPSGSLVFGTACDGRTKKDLHISCRKPCGWTRPRHAKP